MNMITSGAANAAATSLAPTGRAGRAAKILRAGHDLLPFLERGQAIGATDLRTILMNVFGGSDAEGFWAWKDAYEATEVAQVLFLRKFGVAIFSRANAPQAALAMVSKVASLIPTHTRRSEESQQLQQFSTPMPLAFVAARTAGIMADDMVLEPSAGT
ncbi:MAG: methylase, partial [Mesorhizobium sp.]